MSSVSKRRKEGSRTKIKSMGDHKEFLKRITKSLYYGQLPTLPCLSLPVTEISCEAWSEAQRGRSLRRLHADAAAGVARGACVSPCALVLALLYLERLHTANPDYLAATPPADLFLVSLMVGNKFLQDDGEDDEVICSEWAASGGLDLKQVKKLEVEFLSAIDWNVFVSDKSFETGLQWLERQVALKQATARGYFTYGDLTTVGDGELVRELARGAAAAAAAVAAGVAAALLALLALAAAAAPLSRALRPALSPALSPAHPHNNADAQVMTHNVPSEPLGADNGTDHLSPIVDMLLEDSETTEKLRCCTRWFRYREETAVRKSWADSVVLYDWRSLEPWWSTTPVLNWLYQSSLISPMQRWLEKMNECGTALRRELASLSQPRAAELPPLRGPASVSQWLNLSRLGALVASVSDR